MTSNRDAASPQRGDNSLGALSLFLSHPQPLSDVVLHGDGDAFFQVLSMALNHLRSPYIASKVDEQNGKETTVRLEVSCVIGLAPSLNSWIEV